MGVSTINLQQRLHKVLKFQSGPHPVLLLDCAEQTALPLVQWTLQHLPLGSNDASPSHPTSTGVVCFCSETLPHQLLADIPAEHTTVILNATGLTDPRLLFGADQGPTQYRGFHTLDPHQPFAEVCSRVESILQPLASTYAALYVVFDSLAPYLAQSVGDTLRLLGHITKPGTWTKATPAKSTQRPPLVHLLAVAHQDLFPESLECAGTANATPYFLTDALETLDAVSVRVVNHADFTRQQDPLQWNEESLDSNPLLLHPACNPSSPAVCIIDYPSSKPCETLVYSIEGTELQCEPWTSQRPQGPSNVASEPVAENTGSNPPLNDLSFNLGLTDKQREAKNNVVLPYEEAQQLTSTSSTSSHTPAGGAIYYQPDEGDDFDDEDPDDDLDI
ncbi:hypothetical protein IWQ62_000398 [Dispira parvispora]|uniref:Elongator complex protein 5 n=1 Tax=Dispira parvispora TaxID=1520584 RepID=A0A9W8B071_9FUNG|nr:hypothetical protein IWQ62_000398 [Dispira parvispora]